MAERALIRGDNAMPLAEGMHQGAGPMLQRAQKQIFEIE